MKVTLSKRLQMIADKIPNGSRIADIGSDHALLPSYLAQQGQISYAIAGEVNSGPYKAANQQVNQLSMQHMINVRKGDGLSVIQPNEVDVISIAGMGGNLIRDILQDGLENLVGVKQLILQPNVGEETVRRWLFEHNWRLIEEDIMLEDDKIYEILNAVRENDHELVHSIYKVESALKDCSTYFTRDRLFQMGPYLTRKPTPVFIDKWEREIEKWNMICNSLSESQMDRSRMKLKAIQKEICEMKEVLSCCLQRVRR